jgi:hypothetical protein
MSDSDVVVDIACSGRETERSVAPRFATTGAGMAEAHPSARRVMAEAEETRPSRLE